MSIGGAYRVAASWPHAAAMSRPRVSRTVAGSRARSSTALERRDRVPRRAVVHPGRVVGDQVDLEELRIEQGGQLPCALGRVVDAREQHVLDEHLAAAERDVAFALGEDAGQGIAVVDRHDLGTQPGVGRVDRECEPDRLLDLVDEAGQARHPADGRDRRTAVRDPDLRQPSRGGEHLVVVQERLAHAHEDEMVDRLDPAEVEHLVEDLGRAQVAAEAHRTGGAEGARERAPGLGRDAHRAASVAVAHQHCFDRMTVPGAEERLDGAVPCLGLVLDGQGRERDRLPELLAQRTRKVRHLLVAGDAACRPLPHLAGAEGGLAAAGERLLKQCQIHAVTVACAS